MKPLKVAEALFAEFDRKTTAMTNEDRWQAAEELASMLEGVLMERAEREGANEN